MDQLCTTRKCSHGRQALASAGDILRISSSQFLFDGIAVGANVRKDTQQACAIEMNSRIPDIPGNNRVSSPAAGNAEQSMQVFVPMASSAIPLPGTWRVLATRGNETLVRFSSGGCDSILAPGDIVRFEPKCESRSVIIQEVEFEQVTGVCLGGPCASVRSLAGGSTEPLADGPLVGREGLEAYEPGMPDVPGWCRGYVIGQTTKSDAAVHHPKAVAHPMQPSSANWPLLHIPKRVVAELVAISVGDGLAQACEGAVAMDDDAFYGIFAAISNDVRKRHPVDSPRLLPWSAISSLSSLSALAAGPSSVVGNGFADSIATAAVGGVSSLERTASKQLADGRLTKREMLAALLSSECLANESPLVSSSPCALSAVYGFGASLAPVQLSWPTDRDNFLWCMSLGAGSSLPLPPTESQASNPMDLVSACRLLGLLDP